MTKWQSRYFLEFKGGGHYRACGCAVHADKRGSVIGTESKSFDEYEGT
jgi:hypothetical protein